MKRRSIMFLEMLSLVIYTVDVALSADKTYADQVSYQRQSQLAAGLCGRQRHGQPLRQIDGEDANQLSVKNSLKAITDLIRPSTKEDQKPPKSTERSRRKGRSLSLPATLRMGMR